MQRWFFFIFCIIGNLAIGQSSDIVSIQLSLWKHGEFAEANSNLLEASAEIIFRGQEKPCQAKLLAVGMNVNSVELREGRIKGKLKWTQRNDSLLVELPAAKNKRTTIKVDYSIDLQDSSLELYLQNTESMFAFNAMNVNAQSGMGIIGMWFPAVVGDLFNMKLDVTTKAEENIGFNGQEEYKVKLENGLLAHFWKTEKEILPQDFYLIIGTFKEFDAEEMEEELVLAEVSLKVSKYEKSKRAVAPFMVLYGLSVASISDSEYAIVDSLSSLDFSAYFLQKNDLPEIDKKRYQIEAAIAYHIEGNDMKLGSERHLLAYADTKGEEWLDDIMDQKWEKRKGLSSEHYTRVLHYRHQIAKRKVTPHMALYQLPKDSLADSEYAVVDSLKSVNFSAFFLKSTDLPGVSAEQYSYEAALAYYLENQNMMAASERHWNAYVSKRGEDWKNEILLGKWDAREELDSLAYFKALSYMLVKYKKSNPDLLATVSHTLFDTSFVKPLLARNRLPAVHFTYRYVSGDGALYVNYLQDTAASWVYTFPVRIIVRSGDLIDTAIKVVDQASGDLKVIFPKVPNLAKVEVGDFFPGAMTDKRPDTYNLFQLSKAESEAERAEALIGLFETSNPNLFSTALGIAMDDKQARLRLLALDYANDLDASGQRKLKDTIINLSQNDPDADVRQKAKILVSKYYEP